ncbi:NAD(P)/FAD-dependent oxidoreductase [Lampropedia aestuarii]|uniref:NAD(P)/FAD-dependent oxidoreductase n=1 Tax=Lampropedia aestuarii TaxID=2562762 RepID=UPI0024687EF5|nr:FAD-dependent oxidoreductase [Lampropedia aestuarii]MDH5858113.1 FAD-dependent oxidoreductase [Lampropedia aestuarii]
MTHSSTAASTLWGTTAPAGLSLSAVHAPFSADMVVIGGGVTGLSTALHLAQSGASVCLLDAFEIGHRASGRNGGQVVPGVKPAPRVLIQRFGETAAKAMMRFTYGCADEVFELIERYAIDCEPTRNGWIQGAYSTQSTAYLQQRAKQINSHGGEVEFLEQAAVQAATGSSFWPSGLLEKRAGAVQPLAYVRGLARSIVALGVQVYEHSPVETIRAHGSGYQLAVNGQTIHARKVVIATDAYTDQLWPAVAQSYVNVASAQIATDPLPVSIQDRVMPRRAGVSETRKITYYCRIDPEGRFVIGGRGRSSDGIDPATRQQLYQAACERFPALQGIAFPHGWACRVGMTVDDLPHLHELADGLWTAYGYCGRGVALGTAMGRVLSQALRGLPVQDFPVTPVRRIPLYPLRQVGAVAALQWYRLRDAMGYPG